MKTGFTLIEVLISLAVVSILIVTFLPILLWMMNRSNVSAHSAQASLLLQETMEVGYNVMSGTWDADWSLYPPGIYHPAVDMTVAPPVWYLEPGPAIGVEARFARQMEIVSVCRDKGNGQQIKGNCPKSAETRDVNSKLLIGSVTWTEGGIEKQTRAELLVVNLTKW